MSTSRTADHLNFAYWVPNVSGGLVTSTVDQRTDWGIDYNRTLAQHAEQAGFEYALTQVRYLGSYSAEYQHESVSFSLALLEATEKLNVIAAVHPGLWQPGVLANLGSTASELYNGRLAFNIVSGWLRDEFHALGEPWLDHDERYRRSAEFLQVLRNIWTTSPTEFAGDFYRIRNYTLKPQPKKVPQLFQGGSSTAARFNGGNYADWYFTNGGSIEDLEEQIAEVRQHADAAGREVKIGVNAFVILDDSQEKAEERLREIVINADSKAVKDFKKAVHHAGAVTNDQKGMWTNSSLEDLVQYNDGFKTGLIGTRDHINAQIEKLRSIGVDLVLCGFLHVDEEVQEFGEKIITPLREQEANDTAADSAADSAAEGASADSSAEATPTLSHV
ncbi:dimethyl sulfone monooxygenase SfnG [Corynebacterium sp. 320]|uniref:dimethylsulfone monooxygenase SfnG n=1 Tax=Corynebacterium TaxID=1716 RepID=UPI00125CBD6B|nr:MULTISPECIES: dimethyl sulfone monooxygenase SfnG [Corynebacterium]KAB1503146.1 dimethyl sulfone monooxygenase SfnG [Corynebacterium sp. 320]KAB1550640.1 dimethyl sulfone monooxygenase SfnG [Corynebacterium sp. 321]KAB1551002.1 dimethyl sulfone monooxygenase SfnG [Corynebacterium sp. 319]KAB3526943.1 dimethyl sulfone monooxygenase SfnG [Corynebacterium sp. 250]KAB3538436.1 dimethyl sulfone monooxygenase SfnG [Corynebacterium sp. 366]